MSFSIAIPNPSNPSAAAAASSATKTSTLLSSGFPLASTSIVGSLDSSTSDSSGRSNSSSSSSGYSYAGSPPHARNLLPPYTPLRPSPLATASAALDADDDLLGGGGVSGGGEHDDLLLLGSPLSSPGGSLGSAAGGAAGKARKEKGRARSGDYGSSPFAPRRMSLMGRELERAEHIVVEVGSPEAPRLISCVASSQGFDWNRSIFLPPYLARDEDLEIRQDPVTDVTVSDEEARALLPSW